MIGLGRILILLGIILVGVGFLLIFFNPISEIPGFQPADEQGFRYSGREPRLSGRGGSTKTPFLGKLPGDIYVQKKNFTFYFPLATSIVISAVLSLIFWLWPRR